MPERRLKSRDGPERLRIRHNPTGLQRHAEGVIGTRAPIIPPSTAPRALRLGLLDPACFLKLVQRCLHGLLPTRAALWTPAFQRLHQCVLRADQHVGIGPGAAVVQARPRHAQHRLHPTADTLITQAIAQHPRRRAHLAQRVVVFTRVAVAASGDRGGRPCGSPSARPAGHWHPGGCSSRHTTHAPQVNCMIASVLRRAVARPQRRAARLPRRVLCDCATTISASHRAAVRTKAATGTPCRAAARRRRFLSSLLRRRSRRSAIAVVAALLVRHHAVHCRASC